MQSSLHCNGIEFVYGGDQLNCLFASLLSSPPAIKPVLKCTDQIGVDVRDFRARGPELMQSSRDRLQYAFPNFGSKCRVLWIISLVPKRSCGMCVYMRPHPPRREKSSSCPLPDSEVLGTELSIHSGPESSLAIEAAS